MPLGMTSLTLKTNQNKEIMKVLYPIYVLCHYISNMLNQNMVLILGTGIFHFLPHMSTPYSEYELLQNVVTKCTAP